MEEDDFWDEPKPYVPGYTYRNDEIKPEEGNLSEPVSENELLNEIIEGRRIAEILENEAGMAMADQAQIDTSHEEEDEYEDDFELDVPNPSVEEVPTDVYGQYSQDVLTTFDFTKLPPTKDENENPLSIPSSPSEDISADIINNMKCDPSYAASILSIKGQKSDIDTILPLREDSASLVCKEEAINAVFDKIVSGNSSDAARIKKPNSKRLFSQHSEPVWLSHDFLDLLTTELKRQRAEQVEQKRSEDNDPEMQTLNKDVHSVNEVKAGNGISNSGSEPSLNYSEGLKGEITPVPTSSLIPENEDDTTDIIASKDNSKLPNFCYKGGEDEIVNFQVSGAAGPSPKLPKSSIVHCLAGVQELPEFLGPTVSLNLPESHFGYSTTENKRMLNMGQQTDSEPSSPRGGIRLGDNLKVLNEEIPFPDIEVESKSVDVVLSPNRPTTPDAVKPEDSEGELNPFDYENSDHDDDYANNLSTIAGIVAEKKASEEKDTTTTVEEGQNVNSQAEYTVSNPEVAVTGEILDGPAVLNDEAGAAVIENIENDTYDDDFLSDEEEEISQISNPTELESLGSEENVDQPAGTETLTSTTDEEGNISEDYTKCGANFTAIFPNTGSIFSKYDNKGSSNVTEETEDIPEVEPQATPKVDKAADVKKKYLCESILDVIAAERGLEADEEPATSGIPPRGFATDKNALRNERLAKAKKYSAAQSSKLKLATSSKAAQAGKVNKPGSSSAATAGPSTSGKVNKAVSEKVNAQVSPIVVRKPTWTASAGKTVREPSKPKIKPTLTDTATSAANFLNQPGPSGSGVEAAKSGAALPSASGSTGAAPSKNRIRKCSTGPAAAEPKTRSKTIRPITRPPQGYAQKRRDGSHGSRPTTSGASSRPTTGGAASKGKEGPRPSTSKKSGKPVWR